MSESRAQLYFEQTVKEAKAGAEIILWPEFALPVAKEDEAAMIEQGQEIAREEDIYLAMSMGTMAILRAIENGVSVVRVGDNGLSIISDPYGRTLASMDHFTAGERVIVAQVPMHGKSTIYPIIGDLFGWLSVIGFVVITIVAIICWRRTKTTAKPVGVEEELAPAH